MPQWLQTIPARYVTAILVALVVFGAYHAIVAVFHSLSTHDRLSTPYVILRRVLRWIALTVGLLAVLQALGVLGAAWASLTAVFTLVAVGFVAMWSVLSHASCAIIMMITRPFEVGDVIELAETPDAKGTVVDFSLIFTYLETETGDLVQIPNNMFFQRIIRRQAGDVEISLEEQLRRRSDDEH